MKLFSLRTLFYIGVLALSIGVIQIKKSQITAEKAKEVDSVLSIIQENGLPVEIRKVEIGELATSLNVTLKKCGSNRGCFYASREQMRTLKKDMALIDREDDKFIGRVLGISSQPDYQNGLYRVTASIPNEKLDTKAGFYSAEVQLSNKEKVITVPIEALLHGEKGYALWMVQDQKAHKQSIEIGKKNSKRAEVISGLELGQSYVVKGQSQLTEGRPVQPIEPSQSKAESQNSPKNEVEI